MACRQCVGYLHQRRLSAATLMDDRSIVVASRATLCSGGAGARSGRRPAPASGQALVARAPAVAQDRMPAGAGTGDRAPAAGAPRLDRRCFSRIQGNAPTTAGAAAGDRIRWLLRRTAFLRVCIRSIVRAIGRRGSPRHVVLARSHWKWPFLICDPPPGAAASTIRPPRMRRRLVRPAQFCVWVFSAKYSWLSASPPHAADEVGGGGAVAAGVVCTEPGGVARAGEIGFCVLRIGARRVHGAADGADLAGAARGVVDGLRTGHQIVAYRMAAAVQPQRQRRAGHPLRLAVGALHPLAVGECGVLQPRVECDRGVVAALSVCRCACRC